jgi:hypothetical protein
LDWPRSIHSREQCSRRWVGDARSQRRVRSNPLHRERKIALALTIPPECGGKEENMIGRRKRINETKAKNCLGHRDEREKDVGGMTNENDKPRIWVGIGEPTHNATTSDDTMRGGANGKGRERSLP